MAQTPKRPATQKGTIDQLWDHLIGNGKEGVLRRIQADIASMQIAWAAHLKEEEEDKGDRKPKRKTIIFTRFGETILGFIVLGIIGGIFIITGILTPEHLIRLVEALRG